MEVVGATSAIVGLAHSGLQIRKELRDGVKLVCYPPHPLHTLRTLMIILNPYSQVTSEKAALLAALTVYEATTATATATATAIPFSKHVRSMNLDHLPSGMAALPRNVLEVIKDHLCPKS